ncbi:MAG: chemotaxis protein CheA [Pirellulales bacterium]|nr:chemotaxis protein CheA [Pirellulales bacterium]
MSDAAAIPRDEFFESMLGDFLDESGQLLDRLNENMLQLDEWFRSLDDGASPRCDVNLLNEMFRSAHSLKGLSAMLGLSDINHLTHKIENVFDAARKDELPLNCEVVELMFQSIDRLVGLVNVLKDPNPEALDCGDVLDEIHRILESAGVEKKIASQADAEKALCQLMSAGEREATAAPPAENSEPILSERPAEAAEREPPAAEKSSAGVEADHFAGIADEADLQPKYISIFIDETELSLGNLTEVLLALEREGHRAAIEQLLMTSHRIKGSAASIGLNRAAKLAHLMEDLMQDISSGGKSLTPQIADALLACIDGLQTYVDGLKSGRPRTEHFNALARELAASQTAAEAATAVIAADSTAAPGVRRTADSAPAAAEKIDEALRNRVREKIAEAERESALLGIVGFQPHLPLAGLKGRLLYEKLANIGEVRHFSPAVERMEEMEELASLEFGVVTERTLETVKRMLHVGGVTRIEIEPLAPRAAAGNAGPVSAEAAGTPAAEKSPPDNLPSANSAAPKRISPAAETAGEQTVEQAAVKTGKAAPSDNGGKPTETLRVDIERLDQLMNLAGQLVINKARFEQIGDKLKKAVSGRQSRNVLNDISAVLTRIIEPGENGLQRDLESVQNQARRMQHDLEEVRRDVEALAAVRSTVNDLFETIHLLDRVADGIQQSVMDTRMLPIGPLFQRFKRVVRDISRGNGKNIRLEINGEKTELDKRMIDELGDPLIHMVRNSADHGIESPEVRLAAGKPEQGTVTLDAFHRGNSIYIRVGDDGKGLDSERIKAKALERGLISPVEAERMSKSQIFQLIWEPGLSTAEKVTEVSGRGMGMDIVKSKIESLNGTVELDSEPGRGTTVTIKLPLTLAILPSLMVSIDGDIFAMPLESVVEIVSVSPKDIRTVHRRPTARVRGRVVSMVELDAVFSWHGGKRAGGIADIPPEDGPATLVIVNENGRELGLAVDRVIGEQDIVIKSMAENYRNVQGIAGASILGDGRVSLILDLAAVIDMATCKKAEA